MNWYFVLVLALFPYSDAFPTKEKPFSKPPFCRSLECPEYEVRMKTEDFEERCYAEYKWASTDVSDPDYDSAVETGFYRLFDYISGANVPKAKIEMTVPVAVHILAGPGPFCASNFTVNFFVPYKYQEAGPPKPTDKEVYISTIPKNCQYVTSYPGFSSTALIQKNAERLMNALDKAGLGKSYDKSTYYFAGYDSPFELLNRHNEIWLKKKDEKLEA